MLFNSIFSLLKHLEAREGKQSVLLTYKLLVIVSLNTLSTQRLVGTSIKPVHKKMISGFQALRQARAPVTEHEPLQISGRTRLLLCHRCSPLRMSKNSIQSVKIPLVTDVNTFFTSSC
ncbi:hypothetical protein PoB_000324600 [Plakobranchus ocellatus]|uniref:Uncharacterized protein n=1 Tax=Plakobranchus ocellatus TaxID=259542 RepID=A0AAV3Y0W0_9GAST|nr:hypothetical protein PoB_000324600 [Plakobranchus ocellatus]